MRTTGTRWLPPAAASITPATAGRHYPPSRMAKMPTASAQKATARPKSSARCSMKPMVHGMSGYEDYLISHQQQRD
jgi:hypothetical protein